MPMGRQGVREERNNVPANVYNRGKIPVASRSHRDRLDVETSHVDGVGHCQPSKKLHYYGFTLSGASSDLFSRGEDETTSLLQPLSTPPLPSLPNAPTEYMFSYWSMHTRGRNL